VKEKLFISETFKMKGDRYNQLSILKSGVTLTRQGFLINAVIFFCFFTLYYTFPFYVVKQAIPFANVRPIVQVVFYLVMAITLVLTIFVTNKINALRSIYTCSIGILAISLLLFSVPDDVVLKSTLIFSVGGFLAVGLLAFFTYFWRLTVPEERGRIGGLVAFVSLPFYFVSIVMAGNLDFLGVTVLSMVLSLGPLLVSLLRPSSVVLTRNSIERGNYPEKRTILLYSIPCALFFLINATFARNITVNTVRHVSSSMYLSLTLFQIIGAVFGAAVGGIIADFFGRRLSLAFSVTAYGISAAFAGLIQYYALYYFAYIVNGLSWGILLPLYSLVIWGDLANKENCAKMYSIGLITLSLTASIGFLIPTSGIPIIVTSLLICLLIFFSNVPIALAPELLSSDFRERIRLRLHLHAVRKIQKQQNQG